MFEMHTPTNLEDRVSIRRYLPDRLKTDAATEDATTYSEHLQNVLHAVCAYLPRHVVEARLAAPGTLPVFGVFEQATLLFADIAGFTAMSERLTQLGREGAEVITKIVNDYFATMLAIIAQHGGDLFKFGGDALLVCFSGDEGAACGCRAALEMQQTMDRFAAVDTPQGIFSLRMTASLATGPLFLASLGSPTRLEFAVMGPTVEQMARAEHLAKAGEVIVDQATYQTLGWGTVAWERASGFYHVTAIPPLPLPSTFEPLIPSVSLLEDPHWLVTGLDVLTPYLPPEVLRRIVAAPRQQVFEGEHRPVTVLFANFYGINAIIEALGPEQADELTDILNRHFLAMRDVIHKYGGIVNKVDTYAVGYRIMALFGAPVAHEDDPVRAVHAALEMQEAMAAFTDLTTSAGRFSLKQRIGVNTGSVFAGTLGSSFRREYSVMGDEVNLTSRLMGIAPEGQVLVSQSTARQVVDLFELHEHELVKVKGKQEPVRSYRVRRGTAVQTARLAPRGGFFGREDELGVLREMIDAALAGRGAVLDVSGDAGVGKSRLVAEASAYAQQQGMTTLRGEALSYGRTFPYLPWIGVLHRLLGLGEDGSQEAKQRQTLFLASLEQAGLADWAPIVGAVLGIDVAETPLTASLDAQLRQQRFFDVVLQLLQQRAERWPLLLVLDDVQWADAISLDLAAYVARNVREARLLFLIIHRPDLKAPPWRSAAGCQTLHLGELDTQTSLAVAHATLGGVDLSPALRSLILDRAQGNPLFVEEVARNLGESGAIRLAIGESGEREWTLAEDAAGVEVPTTLTGLIMSRIDRLETPNRRLLQVSAVIGTAFRSPVLARTYPYEDLDGTLRRRLAELAELDLLLFAPPDEYTFKHALTQEVAYESLPFARRRALHVRVGQDIEQRRARDLAEHFGVLARHFDRGQAFDKAFTYLVKAGRKAQSEFANEAALDDYRRALEIATKEAPPLPDLEEQHLDVLEAMGDIYLLVGRYAEAIERFQQAIDLPLCLSRQCGDLLRKVAKAHEQQGNYEDALRYLDRGKQILSANEQDEHSVEMARTHDLLGWVHMRRGEAKAGIEACKQGLAILEGFARDDELLRDEADLYKTLGAIHAFVQGNYSQAAQVYQHSTELYEQAGNLPGLARSYSNLALTAWAQGDLTKAQDYLEQSMKISRKIGDSHMLALSYNNLGVVSYTTGDLDHALNYYEAALTLRERIGDNHGVAQTCSNMGETLVSLERYDEAHRYLDQAATMFEAIQSEGELPEVYRLLAELELARKDETSALSYAKRAQVIAKEIGSPELRGIVERTLARGQAQAGDTEQAQQSFEASIELLHTSGNQIEVARSHYEYGCWLAELKIQEKTSHEQLQMAIDLFDAAGAEKEADQARRALVQVRS